MTPNVLLQLQRMCRELDAQEITVTCNDRGTELRADGDLIFTDMTVAPCRDSSLLAFGAAIMNGEVEP